MKILVHKIAITTTCLLAAGIVFADDKNQADTRWLAVVEKKITSGQTQISTPMEGRANLLKEWAGRNGYSVQITKSENGFRANVAKTLAQK